MSDTTGGSKHRETGYIKDIGPRHRTFVVFECQGAWAVEERQSLFRVYPTLAQAKIAAHMLEKGKTP